MFIVFVWLIFFLVSFTFYIFFIFFVFFFFFSLYGDHRDLHSFPTRRSSDLSVQVHVQALNRDFEGKVARFADAVDPETRTMHTEVDVKNPGGTLVQGMYAEVSLVLARKESTLTVPIQAVVRNGADATVL